jgi:exopolysaccharide production protein ExoQ
MSPFIALLIWLVLLLGLLCFDPAKTSGVSVATWIPLIWLFFVGTRLPSQWIGGQMGTLAEAYEGSDPLNRDVFLALTLIAVAILIARSLNWGDLFARNLFLMAFIFFALMSVFWSDFPLIAFKRWFRDLGAYLAMLVALSDTHPLEGVRTVLRRFCYLTIPLSVLLVKYYPQLGRSYDAWSGVPVAVGATTAKNLLGVACLVAGIFFFWDIVTRWSDRVEGRTKRILFVNFAFMAMTVWLLYHAHSATSNVCLAIGCFVILMAATKVAKRHASLFRILVPTCFVSYVILAYWFNANAYLVGAVGRNPTLTDRTFIWKTLLGIGTNPLVGTGYRSFFLGARLQEFWRTFRGINEAHNGYLDLYLNLGIIGLVLFLGFLMASYRTIWERARTDSPLASLGLAIWTALLFYNITEASFDGGLLWLTLMLIGISLAGVGEHQVSRVSACDKVGAAGRFSRVPSGSAGLRKPNVNSTRDESLPRDPSLSARSLPGLLPFGRQTKRSM